MDSCVCAALAVRDSEAAALHVSYGQRTQQKERRSFENICDWLKIGKRLVCRNETLKAIGGSALTDSSIDVPEATEQIGGTGIPITYVPFRNAHFLAAAVATRAKYWLGPGSSSVSSTTWPEGPTLTRTATLTWP